MGCSPAAVYNGTAPSYSAPASTAPAAPPVAGGGTVQITWGSYSGSSVDGTLSWPQASGCTGYYVLGQDQSGNIVAEYLPGETNTSYGFVVGQGVQVFFSVAACINNNIPPGTGCPTQVGEVTSTAPVKGASVPTPAPAPTSCTPSPLPAPGPLVPYLISATSSSLTIGFGAYSGPGISYNAYVTGPGGYNELTGPPTGTTTFTIKQTSVYAIQPNSPYTVYIRAVALVNGVPTVLATGPTVTFCTTS